MPSKLFKNLGSLGLFGVLDRLFEGGLWLLLLFSPLLVGVGNIDAYRTIQATFSIVLILFLLAVWGIRLTLADSWRRVMSFPAVIPLFAFLGWTALSLTQSPSPALGGQSVFTLCAYAFLYLAIADRARDEKMRSRLLLLVLVPFALNAFVGILQYLKVDILSLNRFFPNSLSFTNYLLGLQAPSRLGSAAGVLGNQDVLGWYLTAPLALLLGLFLAEKGWRRLPFLLLSALGLVGLFATMTRGAWIGMIVALICMAALLFARFRPFIRKNRVAILAGILVFSLASVGVASSVGLTQRVFSRVTGSNNTVYQRLNVAQVARRMANEKPILGNGLGSFKVLFFKTLVRQFPEGIPSNMHYRFVQAHNDYVQAMAETGYPGLLLALLALGFYFFERLKRLKTLEGKDGVLAIGEIGALVAILVGALSGFPFHIAACSVVFVVLAGTLASRGERKEVDELSTDKKKLLFLGFESAGLGILALTMVASVMLQYQADLFVKQGMGMIQNQDFAGAESLLTKAIAFDGMRGDARVQLGYALAMQGRGTEAAREIEASRATFDDVATHYYLGFVYRGLGKPAQARQEYQCAMSYFSKDNPTRGMIEKQLQALDRSVAINGRQAKDLKAEKK